MAIPVLFLVQVLLVPPFGNFPLNDDWTAALSVQAFVEHGEIYYPSWLSAMSHVPILYGILATKLFGFSFVVLRVGTLLLSLASAMVLYAVLRRMRVVESEAVMLTGLLCVNPLYMSVSYTFLSDIPALFLLVLSVYCFVRAAKERPNTLLLLLAALVSVVGFFTRQVNILWLAAMGSVVAKWVWDKRYSARQLLVAFGQPAVLCVVLYVVLGQVHLLPGQIGARFLPDGFSYMETFCKNIWQFTVLLGLFFSPLTLSILAANRECRHSQRLGIFVVTGAGLAIVMGCLLTDFQFMGNIISHYGLGTTRAVMQGDLIVWGREWWYVVLYIIGGGLVGALSFLLYEYRALFNLKSSTVRACLIFIALYGGLLSIIQAYDRYILLLIPLLLILLVPLLTLRYSKMVMIALLLAQWSYGIVGTHNYLAWQQARWQLSDRLLSRSIAPEKIEGGYEWDGWQYYRQTRGAPLGTVTPFWAPWYVNDLYSGHLMQFIVAFSPLGGYKVFDSQAVDGWLYFPIKRIYANQVVPKNPKAAEVFKK